MRRRPRLMGHDHPVLRGRPARRLREADFLPPPAAVEPAYEVTEEQARSRSVVEVLVETGLFPSKTKARDACLQGRVMLNGSAWHDGDTMVAWHDEVLVDGKLLFGGAA